MTVYLYATAAHEVRLWLKQYGEDGLHDMIDGLRSGRSFDAVSMPIPR